jgi:hypothetical protein
MINIQANKFIMSLLACITLILTGCGGGGGAADSKTGVLAPTTITISPATPSNVSIGLTTKFTAQSTYADGSKADITTQVIWATGDATIATIDSTGKATGLKAGSGTTVIATLSGVSSSPVTLNVNSKAISSINISTTTASVPKGRAADFVATASYSDGTSGAVTGSVIWSSDNALVTTLSSTGNASTLTTGTANITASTTVGTTVVTSNTVQLSVTAPVLATLSISPSSGNVAMGGKQQFSASGLLTDGTVAVLGALNWASSNTSFLTIDSTGLSTGISTGSCIITASSASVVSNNVLINVSSKSLLGGNVQGVPLSLSTVVSTFAGSGVLGATDAVGTSATFSYPMGITTDGSNLYVTDFLDHKIRKIVIATGVVTTLAGSGSAGAIDATGTAASFNNPHGITTDGTHLYVADYSNFKIRKIEIATGIVTTMAGSGISGSVDGVSSIATFAAPSDITTDGNNLYVSDNNKIRKININTGEVSTLAGSGTAGAIDAIGTAASFNLPTGIATDGSNLYVADDGNNKIRKILISTGSVTTLAGTGTVGAVDATGIAASFNNPAGITTDGTNLFVSELINHKIRKIVIATGVVTTLAGSGTAGVVDAVGTTASFTNPQGIISDGNYLYVADRGNNKIRKIQ